jgi:hypothetical protein
MIWNCSANWFFFRKSKIDRYVALFQFWPPGLKPGHLTDWPPCRISNRLYVGTYPIILYVPFVLVLRRNGIWESDVVPLPFLRCKNWFFRYISESWFDCKLQLLRNSQWSMEAEKFKIACLGSKYASWLSCAVSNVCSCYARRVQLMFLLQIWTDLARLRKNGTCPVSIGPTLTELKITKVLLDLRKRTLVKMRKARGEIIQVANWVR